MGKIHFIVLVFLICLLPLRCSAQGQTIRCYNCTGDGLSDNCAVVGPSTPMAGNCASCGVYFYYGEYLRSCYTFPEITYCQDDFCACSTNLCNNMKFLGIGGVSCYECEGTGKHIDNGCGETIDPNSIYVKQVHGCKACFTEKSYGVYTRGCIHESSTGDKCLDSPSTTNACVYECKTDFCNAAGGGFNSTPSSFFSLILASLAAITSRSH